VRTIGRYSLPFKLLQKIYIKKLILSPSSDNLKAVFSDHPKLVVAMNHGPMAAPIYVNLALSSLLTEHDISNRRYIAIIWKYFYKVPIYRQMAQFITQVKDPVSFDEFVDMFESPAVDDFYVMPEGENCCYGNGVDIEPFLSAKFIEIALRANTPILLAVHHGTHLLARPITISESVEKLFRWAPEKTYKRLQESKCISLPRIKIRLPQLQFIFKVYNPTLTLSELSPDDSSRKKQLNAEGDKIRMLMQEMVGTLKHEKLKSA